jgi:hypothetical protein
MAPDTLLKFHSYIIVHCCELCYRNENSDIFAGKNMKKYRYIAKGGINYIYGGNRGIKNDIY